MRVRALENCQHDKTYRFEGDEFEFKGAPEQLKAMPWLEPVGGAFEPSAEAVEAAKNESPDPLGEGRSAAILAALSKLDHDNDAHWTQTGSPKIDAVREMANDPGITSAEVKALYPDFVRSE